MESTPPLELNVISCFVNFIGYQEFYSIELEHDENIKISVPMKTVDRNLACFILLENFIVAKIFNLSLENEFLYQILLRK